MTTPIDISPEAVAQQDAHLVHNGHRHAADMLTALRLQLTARAWQSIETCPKDLRVLVTFLYHGERGQAIATNWTREGFIWPSNAYIVTHWQPLPENPT